MCVVCVGVTAAATGLGGLIAPPTADLSSGQEIPTINQRAETSQSINTHVGQTRSLAGKRCKKRGAKRTVNNVTFTCRKSGNRLVWVRTSRRPAPPVLPITPTEPTYEPPSTTSASPDVCRLLDISPERRRWNTQASGFPTLERYVPHQGTVRMALIPIDWADLPGDPNFIEHGAEQTRKLTQWFDNVSDGRLKVEWVIHPHWIRMPGSANAYAVPYSGDKEATARFFGRVIPAVDPAVDFSGVQVANFLLPRGQTVVREGVQDWPWEEFSARTTNEGRLVSAAAAGAHFDQGPREYWAYWAHEFGHVLQLAHVGSSRARSSMHSWDLMGDQDGPTRELSSWMRFVAGWLSDDQIYCQERSELQPTTIMLNPLTERTPGVKSAIVRISPTRAIIVESRRPNDLRCSTINNPAYQSEGVLVYTYDATKGHNEEFLQVFGPPGRAIIPSGCWTEPEADPLLQSGDSVTVHGITISVVSGGLGHRYDTVTISPT